MSRGLAERLARRRKDEKLSIAKVARNPLIKLVSDEKNQGNPRRSKAIYRRK